MEQLQFGFKVCNKNFEYFKIFKEKSGKRLSTNNDYNVLVLTL